MLQIRAQKDACSWAVRKTPTLHGLQRVRRVDQHLAHICNQARMILVSKIGTMLHGRGYDGGGGSPPSRALARARRCRDTTQAVGRRRSTHTEHSAARASAASPQWSSLASAVELIQCSSSTVELIFSGNHYCRVEL